MGEMLALSPEGIEKEIHPHALRRYEEWKADIRREIPLDELNGDDLNACLSDGEKPVFQSYLDKIRDWLMQCSGIGDGYSPYPYTTDVIHPMAEIKSLLGKVYQLKLKRAEEEQRRACERAEAERRQREEKERRTAADRKLWKFNRSLNKEIGKLRSMLYPEKQSPEDYFEKYIVDQRYMGQTFVHLISDEDKQALQTRINRITKASLDKLIPRDFSKFIDWKYRTYYFLLPSAGYSVEGVACLDFYFDIFSVVEVNMWVKPGKKSFNDYIFNLPWLEEHNCVVRLDEPKLLGYRYLLFTPHNLGSVFWQTIPLILVSGLANGDMEPAGTTILEASEAGSVYSIEGLEGNVTIPESFADYLREMGGIDGMAVIGILSERVANIARNKLVQLGEEGQAEAFKNGQVTGFADKEFTSSLTALGIPLKDAENLLGLIPENLALPEAIKLALEKHGEIIAQHSLE